MERVYNMIQLGLHLFSQFWQRHGFGKKYFSTKQNQQNSCMKNSKWPLPPSEMCWVAKGAAGAGRNLFPLRGVTFTRLQLMVGLENFRLSDASLPDILREPGHSSFM